MSTLVFRLRAIVDEVRTEQQNLPIVVRPLAAPIINPIIKKLEQIIGELENITHGN